MSRHRTLLLLLALLLIALSLALLAYAARPAAVQRVVETLAPIGLP